MCDYAHARVRVQLGRTDNETHIVCVDVSPLPGREPLTREEVRQLEEAFEELWPIHVRTVNESSIRTFAFHVEGKQQPEAFVAIVRAQCRAQGLHPEE